MTEQWRRLSVRVVYLDLARVLIALVPGYLGAVVFNDGIRSGR